MEAEQTTPGAAAGGDTLLKTAHSLQTLFTTRLTPSSSSPDASAALIHPLSAIAPASVPYLRAALASTVSAFRTGVSQFSSLTLPQPGPTDGEETKDAKARRDRYLTLLRDAAGTEAYLLATRKDDAVRARRVSKRRRREYEGLWDVRTPSGAEEPSALAVLEGLAKDLELVTFRDDDGIDGGRKDGPITLSVGGKVMVVDFEVVAGKDVAKVKVAYVVDAQDLQCAVAADKLHALLRHAREKEEDETVQQRCWRSVKSVLEQLKELDEATERLGQDCFTALNRTLSEDLRSFFPAPETRADAEQIRLPLILPTPASLQPRLLYHATPFARLTSSFSSTISAIGSSFAASSPPYEPSLRQPAIYSVSISLAAIEDGSDAAKTDSQIYIATLDPPVPFEAATGRAVCRVLGVEMRETDDRPRTEAAKGRSDGRGLLDLMLPSAGDGRAGAAQRNFEMTFPASSASSALTIRFDTARAVGGSSEPAFLATHLRFKEPQQLRDALKVLEAQVRMNELVKSVALEREIKRSQNGQEDGIESGAKRGPEAQAVAAKVNSEEKISLDDLFAAPNPDAPVALPGSIHFPAPAPSPPSAVAAPSVALSFPFPSLSPASPLTGLPLALTIASPFPSVTSPDERAYSVSFSAPQAVCDALSSWGVGAQDRLEKSVERVLDVTGNLGLALREVVKELRRVVN